MKVSTPLSQGKGRSRDGRSHFNDISNSVDISLKRYKGNNTQKLVLNRNLGENQVVRRDPTNVNEKDAVTMADNLEAIFITNETTTKMSESRSLKALIQTPLTTPLPTTTVTAQSSKPTMTSDVVDDRKKGDVNPTYAPKQKDFKKKPQRKTFFHPIQRKPLSQGVPPRLLLRGNTGKVDRKPLFRRPQQSFPYRRMPIRSDSRSAAPMRFPARKVEPSAVTMAAQRYPFSPGASSMMPRSNTPTMDNMNDGPVVEVGPFPLGSGSGLRLSGMGKTTGFVPSAGGIPNPQDGKFCFNAKRSLAAWQE